MLRESKSVPKGWHREGAEGTWAAVLVQTPLRGFGKISLHICNAPALHSGLFWLLPSPSPASVLSQAVSPNPCGVLTRTGQLSLEAASWFYSSALLDT